MDDNNVYIFDETNPLRQPRGNNLTYRSQPQDTANYLVQIPDARPTDEVLARESQPRRSRAASIVNTQQLPDTIEEDEPLEHFIRKNLPNFRKSLAAQDIEPNLQRRTLKNADSDQIVVTPSSLSMKQKDSIPIKVTQTKPKGKENNDLNVNKDFKPSGEVSLRENTNVPLSKTEQINKNLSEKDTPVTFKTDISDSPTTQGQIIAPRQSRDENEKLESRKQYNSIQHPGSYKGSTDTSNNYKRKRFIDTPQSPSNIEISSKRLKKDDVINKQENPYFPNKDISVFPAISDPVSVTQQSPFKNEKLGLDKQPSSKVKLMVMIDSDKDQDKVRDWKMKDGKWVREDGKYTENNKANNDGGIRGNKHNTGTQQKSKNDDYHMGNINQENDNQITRSIWKNKDYNKGTSRDLDNKKNKENIENNSIRNLEAAKDVNSKKLELLDQKRISREQNQAETNRGFKHPNLNNQLKQKLIHGNNLKESDKPKSIHKHSKKPVESHQSNYINPKKPTQETLWMAEGNLKPLVYTLQTEPNPGNPPLSGGKKGSDISPNINKTKSRKSIVKSYARKRYHIEMPEDPKPETSFTVRFNLNDENNVDMTYKGPVKITNYYTERK